MKTFCVFQACDESGLNRLVDRIVFHVEDGIDYYRHVFRDSEVLFLPDHNEKDDMPESLMFLDPANITVADIEWLRDNQDSYGTPIKDWIQYHANRGDLGITRGLIVRTLDDEVFLNHLFMVELRHVYLNENQPL